MKMIRAVIAILVCTVLISCVPTTVFSAEDYIDPELCEHEYMVYVEELFPSPYCVNPQKYVCELCGDEYTVEGVRHGECIWIVIVEPAFGSDGVEMLFCTKCKGSAGVFPVRHESVTPTLFADVDYNAWYGYAVEYCGTFRYMQGTAKRRFEPNAYLTREQLAIVISKLCNADTEQYRNTDSGMKDVPTGEWYSGAVAWAVKEGYMVGIGDGRFGLGKAVDRATFATVLHRYAVTAGFGDFDWEEYIGDGSVELTDYSDHQDIPDWARESMRWAATNCIMIGTDKNEPKLSPSMTMTRAQCARAIKNTGSMHSQIGCVWCGI